MNAYTDKKMTQKVKVYQKKPLINAHCIWQTAEWLAQYSRILESLQGIQTVR